MNLFSLCVENCWRLMLPKVSTKHQEFVTKCSQVCKKRHLLGNVSAAHLYGN